MHECLLFGSVPPAQHDHVRRVLAGVAAMQPRSMQELHLIFEPTSPDAKLPIALPGRPIPGKTAPMNAQQAAAKEAFYLQLVTDLTSSKISSRGHGPNEEDSTKPRWIKGKGWGWWDENEEDKSDQSKPDVEMVDGNATKDAEPIDWTKNSWNLEFKNIPEVQSKRPATSRLIATLPVKATNPQQQLENMGYAYKSAYVLVGSRFVHEFLDIRLYRAISLANPMSLTKRKATDPRVPASEEINELAAAAAEDQKYILEAKVLVRDGSKIDQMDQAMQELVNFKNTMADIVTLEPVDRMTLNTRVKFP